jgi:hypothetical protein
MMRSDGESDMSDKPLFQDADEQEALWGNAREVGSEEAAPVVVPAAAAAGGALSGQLASGIPGTGAAPAVGAVVAGATLSSEDDADKDGVVETD